MYSIFITPQEGVLWRSVWSLHALLVSVCVFCKFLTQSKNMHIIEIDLSGLVEGCLFASVLGNRLAT